MPIETYPEIVSMAKGYVASIVAKDKDNGTYTHISMRTALKAVGCNDRQIEGTLKYCADNNFSYCLDPTIAHGHFTTTTKDYPPAFACEWGADQLLSRLWAVR